jgi:hypothetical protein
MSVRPRLAIACAAIAALWGGCSETMPLGQLPDLTKLPDKVLSKDEQQGKIEEMIEKSHTHQAEAVKAIEKGDVDKGK